MSITRFSVPALLLLASTAIASMTGTDGKSSGLTTAQLKQIQKAGKVVVPTYLPPHFKVKKVTEDQGEYAITYSGPHGAELDVQMASEGIGDIPLDSNNPHAVSSTRKVHNSTFGTQSMDVLTAAGDHQFAVNWVDLGAHSKPEFLSIIGRQMSSEMGARVWQSLRYLKK